jgi:hypothetical protein
MSPLGYLYYSGRIDTTLPFDELRRRSLPRKRPMTHLTSPSAFEHPCRRSLADQT